MQLVLRLLPRLGGEYQVQARVPQELAASDTKSFGNKNAGVNDQAHVGLRCPRFPRVGVDSGRRGERARRRSCPSALRPLGPSGPIEAEPPESSPGGSCPEGCRTRWAARDARWPRPRLPRDTAWHGRETRERQPASFAPPVFVT